METLHLILEISTTLGSIVMGLCGLWHSWQGRWAQAAFYMAFAAWLIA